MALLVLQLRDVDEPLVTVVGLRETPVTLGAATTLNELDAAVPATPMALYGVTVQEPAPVLEVVTAVLPFTVEPE